MLKYNLVKTSLKNLVDRKFIVRIITLLLLLISVLKGEIIYETDFDDFTIGPNQWAGNNGWISNDITTGAQAIEEDLLPALLNVATLGFERPNSDLTFVGLNLEYDHVATGKPIIVIDTILGIEDSTNDQRDDFYFSIYNAGGDRLASIRFDNQDPNDLNSQFGIWREDGVNQFDTQLDFIPGELYNIFVKINLNDNTWSADIDGIPLFENSQFSNTEGPINLGFIAYEWDLTAATTQQHGDNFFLVADILVEALDDPSDGQVNPATLTLNDLAQIYDGNPKPITATTDPADLAVTITYNGNSVPPTEAGSYAVEATLETPNYTGSANGTLVISAAPATVTLDDLAQIYDGNPKPVTATTNPAGLAVKITYDGSSEPPTEAGSYAVEVTLETANYTGSANGTLVISAALATVTLDDLAQIYDGNPKPITATTDPADLAVTITYNGNSVPPTAVGSYAVEVSVTDSNYVGSATSTLVVAQAIPALTFEFQPSGQISLTWQTSPGWTDQVQYSDDLITWFNDLPSSTFTSDTSPGMTTFLPENDLTVPCRFYRLRRTQSP